MKLFQQGYSCWVSKLLAQLLALPATQAWIALIGAVSFIAAGDWNPVTVIQGQGEGLSLVVLLVLVILAQWSTNNAANLIPVALAFVNAGAPKVSYPVAVAIAAVVGTLFMPWAILDNLFSFLFSYGAFLSAIGGIMVSDYYFVRKRCLNVPHLYREHGQFHYIKGFNPAGIIAWLVAGSVAFFSGQWAFLLGFVLGALIYFAIMKLYVMKRFFQEECGDTGSEDYLGTSAGYNWAYDEASSSFLRLRSDEIEEVSREDL